MIKKIPQRFFLLSLLLSGCATQKGVSGAAAQSVEKLNVAPTATDRARLEATGTHFVIATQGLAATQAAKAMMDKGGNLIDAAIAASFAISVERPQSTGIGGGGFMVYHDAKTKKSYAIDFRERAPLKAFDKMYLDKDGNVKKGLSEEGILAVATPGLVRGLYEIKQKFGSKKVSWKDTLQPAIALAEQGFEVYPHLANAIGKSVEVLSKQAAAKAIFLKPDGTPYKVGDRLVQKDLGHTLRLIADKGPDVFYKGEIAKAIVKESNAQNGLLSPKDLSGYQVKWRAPVKGTYQGFEIDTMPPPSAGGLQIVEILNIVEKDPLKEWGFLSPQALHLEAAAMQQSFADRTKYIADPDFFKEIPMKGLVSKKYAEEERRLIDLHKARKADEVSAGKAPDYESTETTNFSMMDSEGNVLASTQSVNGYLGSGVVATGTGIVLNNTMNDFAEKPGASNLYGAVGSQANAVAPRKTPLSSMSPTIVLKDGAPVMALGAPGGTRIGTCVAQTMLNYLTFGMPLFDAVAARRLHHQWKNPDALALEPPASTQNPGAETALVNSLKGMGYEVQLGQVPCRVNAVSHEGNVLRGAADPRDIGSSYGQ